MRNEPNRNQLQAIVDEHLDNMHSDINEQMKGSIANDTWYMENSVEAHETTLLNIYFDSINWQPAMPDGKPYPLAWIRPDIIEKGLAVPVGETFYGKGKPLPYRWFNEDTFEVCLGCVWHEAQSIDWDFTDAVPKYQHVGMDAGIRADGCKGK